MALKDKVRHHFPEIVLGFFILAILAWSFYSFFIDLYPQKSNTDMWTHLAVVNELKQDDYDSINAIFYPYGLRDPRGGSFLAVVALVSKILNISTINTYLFFGLINVAFFLVALYLLARQFLKDRIMSVLFPILALLLWGYSRNIMAGMFSLNEVLWMGPFLHFFVMGTLFMTVVFADRFLSESGFSLKYFCLVLVLGYLTLNSHILTGLFLFVALFSLGLAEAIKRKKLNRNILLIGFSLIAIFCLNFVWPLYSTWDFLFPADSPTQVTLRPGGESINGLGDLWAWLKVWMAMGGTAVLGLIFLLKPSKKLLFFSILLVLNLLILISGILPMSMKFYWRFFVMVIFACISGWLIFIGRNRFRFNMVLITLILLLGVFYTKDKMDVFADWQPYTYQQSYYKEDSVDFGILEDIPRDKVIFADEMESHILSGLTGHNVVGVRPQHASFAKLPEQTEGYYDIQKTYEEPSYINQVIDKFGVDYILIKKTAPEKQEHLADYIRQNFELWKSNQLLELYLAHY
ncbi:MAG: hypothetical protein ABIB97_00825 [Patescibacteria group bacterium]